MMTCLMRLGCHCNTGLATNPFQDVFAVLTDSAELLFILGNFFIRFMEQMDKLIVYAIAVLAITVLLLMQSVNHAVVAVKTANEAGFRKAPPAISGDNV